MKYPGIESRGRCQSGTSRGILRTALVGKADSPTGVGETRSGRYAGNVTAEKVPLMSTNCFALVM